MDFFVTANMWVQRRHYEKAPIKEAIIDVQTEISPAITMDCLETLAHTLLPGYTPRNKLISGQFVGHVEGEPLTATARQNPLGFALVGAEGKQVVQLKQNGLTFSRLTPYENWEQLRDESRRLWNIYREAVGSVPVVRLALRYVNQLDLPRNLRDFRDYLRIYPEISTDLPQQLSSFFMQVQIPQTDIHAMVVLNETIVPSPSQNVVSVILDIDLFKDGLEFQSDDEIWSLFEDLRVRKNLIFEGCITNNTRELIS